jgi:hypothetical protein
MATAYKEQAELRKGNPFTGGGSRLRRRGSRRPWRRGGEMQADEVGEEAGDASCGEEGVSNSRQMTGYGTGIHLTHRVVTLEFSNEMTVQFHG